MDRINKLFIEVKPQKPEQCYRCKNGIITITEYRKYYCSCSVGRGMKWSHQNRESIAMIQFQAGLKTTSPTPPTKTTQNTEISLVEEDGGG